jgi:starch synthase
MNIVHISGEAAPFVLTGGLGTFVEKLSASQAAMGHDVRVCIPFYMLTHKDEAEIKSTEIKINVNIGCNEHIFTVHTAFIDGVEYNFFENAELFGRTGIYGSGDFNYADNDIRYAAFSQACLFFLADHCSKPSIIHCHDWQAGLVPLYSSLLFRDMKWHTVFTIHDVQWLGLFQRMDMEELNLPQDVYNIEGIEFYGQISFLKAGIVYSDFITTVSPTYAADIQTDNISGGMAGIITKYSYKLKGILNGIDYSLWNCRTDTLINCRPLENKGWKKECKAELASEFGFDPNLPLFVMIGRMSNKKGLELLLDATDYLSKKNASFFILGHGDKYYARLINKLSESFDNFYTYTRYDHILAHKLFAAADFILAPSVYEPFGSSHLIGTRYGAMPLVNPTGGTGDTVKFFTDEGLALVMNEYTLYELLAKVDEAIQICNAEGLKERIIQASDHADLSWEKAASEYLIVYRQLSKGGGI